jgi:uncharacterized membrane protein YedE/YeeE
MAEAVLLSLVFLLIGILIGFLAQRSRMCFVAGLRDYLLVRDTELLMGLFSFLATVWVATSLLYALGLLEQGMPEYGELEMKGALSDASVSRLGWSRLLAPRALGTAQTAVPLAALANRFLVASAAGGWLLGLLSVAAGGCVLRQHVLCAQGNRNALLFVLGFYAAVPVYYLALGRLFSWVYQ